MIFEYLYCSSKVSRNFQGQSRRLISGEGIFFQTSKNKSEGDSVSIFQGLDNYFLLPTLNSRMFCLSHITRYFDLQFCSSFDGWNIFPNPFLRTTPSLVIDELPKCKDPQFNPSSYLIGRANFPLKLIRERILKYFDRGQFTSTLFRKG